MMDDSPRTIAITGVTKGLGRALVERFVERGHQVFGCGRSPGLIAELARAHLAPHDFAAVDVAEAAAVEAWAARVIERAGAPDLLVNNAALVNRNAPLWEVPAEEMAALLAVNVAGTHHTIRAFTPSMIERGSGVIVNISSGWGRSTAPEVGPYCATKWAIEGLTRSLAQELPAGLASVAVNPGIIDTEMLRSCWGEGAAGFSDADSWSHGAADFLLGIGLSDNGQALTIG
jgi:NAD(P)-dependent dehydrogenase (short-subunit alcohol dehydrogenase family)